MQAGDVCSILETCSKNNVRELTFGALSVSFGPERPTETPAEIPAPINHEKINRATLADEEVRLRAETLALLAIEDPIEYERQIMNGELGPNEPEPDYEAS